MILRRNSTFLLSSTQWLYGIILYASKGLHQDDMTLFHITIALDINQCQIH